MTINPYTDLALNYCDDVLTGKIPACKQIRQACQRHLDDLARIDTDPAWPYTYDVAKAERVCNFAARLPHVAGRWAALKNNRFNIQPWQAFIFTSLFGWVNKETGYRRFREALISVARKNGKSFIASVICLYGFLCDAEPGAQVFAAANNLKQALTVFEPARLMVDRVADLRNTFAVEVNKHSLVLPDGSSFVPLVGTPRDGQSAHVACLDEYHEAIEDSLYLSLSQSMGARTQSLMLVTTTAGVTIEGPCHKFHQECEEVLDGKVERPELFAVIYTLDPETNWTTEAALVMANPNLGVSVFIDKLRTDHRNAIRSAAKQNAFKTKHLNIWCNASTAWMNMSKWSECADSALKPEDFIGQPCWIGADFSSKLDLTCIVKLFKVGGTYYVFPRFYLPSERALDPSLGMYARWVSSGHLTATEGTAIDMEQVLNDTVADIEKYKPLVFAFDRHKAETFNQFLQKRCPDTPCVDVPMRTQFISGAMHELEALVYSKQFRHANNPVLNWNMANVVCTPDLKTNTLYPSKTRNDNKVDGAVSIVIALSRAMLNKPEREYFTPFYL